MKITIIILALAFTYVINSQSTGGYDSQNIKNFLLDSSNNQIYDKALKAAQLSVGPAQQFVEVQSIQTQVVTGIASGTNTKFTLLYQSLSDKTVGKEIIVIVFSQLQTNQLQVISLVDKDVPIKQIASQSSASTSSNSAPELAITASQSNSAVPLNLLSSSSTLVSYIDQNIKNYLANTDNTAGYQLALKVSTKSIGAGYSLPEIQSIANQIVTAGTNIKYTFIFQNLSQPTRALQFVVVVHQSLRNIFTVQSKEKTNLQVQANN